MLMERDPTYEEEHQKKTAQPIQPRLNSFKMYCRAFRETKKQQFSQLNMLGFNRKLWEDWHKLTPTEKVAFKPSTETVPEAI